MASDAPAEREVNDMARGPMKQELYLDGVTYVTVDKIAEVLSLSKSHVRELARSGTIPAMKVGARHWFNLASVKKSMGLTKKAESKNDTADDENDPLAGL